MVLTGNFLITIIGRDQVGVVSDVSSYLFDIGANLADSSYSILGQGFEFSCVAGFDSDVTAAEINKGLAEIDCLIGARITVDTFEFETARGDAARITHIVDITGGDRPGLVARMSEVLMEYDANIVRMSSKRQVDGDGTAHYRTRFAINAAPERFEGLSAALFNTAGSLRLDCNIEEVTY
jgi:glycine cleavage system transcriptional repressor